MDGIIDNPSLNNLDIANFHQILSLPDTILLHRLIRVVLQSASQRLLLSRHGRARIAPLGSI
jgi:hypothetical protein